MSTEDPMYPAFAEQPYVGSDVLTHPEADVLGAELDPALEAARRRKKVLVIILSVMAALFIVLAAWYFLTRKPLTELPGISTGDVPTYSSSFNGVSGPLGVAVSPDGERIYVTEGEAPFLTRVFDRSGSEVGTLVPPKGKEAGNRPTYVAVDPTNDEVYVTDLLSQSIYVYDRDGTYSRAFIPQGIPAKEWRPLGVGFSPEGTLFVSDLGGLQTVREFRADGSIIRVVGEPGETSFANGFAVDGAGNVAIADSNNGRVVFYDKDGAIVAQINRGAADGELSLPRGLAIDDRNRLYVADAINQHVQVYDIGLIASEGIKYVGTFGIEGSGDGQFEYPNGAAADTRGRVYVTDRVNNRLQVWSN
jgi:DNA-binding beta-propeller fold protein YncE